MFTLFKCSVASADTGYHYLQCSVRARNNFELKLPLAMNLFHVLTSPTLLFFYDIQVTPVDTTAAEPPN